MAAKNLTGELGERCKTCSGMGYTLSITDGGSHGCQRCDQTGIEPVNSNFLQRQIDQLTQILEKHGIIHKQRRDVRKRRNGGDDSDHESK